MKRWNIDAKGATTTLFVLGIMFHLFLALRSWIGGDQIHILNLGIDFAAYGTIHPFAKLMSGAGGNPGALLQLLVGIPLKIVPHYQSPMILVLIFHFIAGWVLLSMFRREFGDVAALFFVIVYWLSPWRLYNGGFLWEPSFIFLPAALHLWSCWHIREKRTFVPSAILGLSLLTSAQIHNSAFILFLLTIILGFRKQIFIWWPGFALGVLIGSLTLVPTLSAVLAGSLPEARASQGFVGESLLKVYPVLKGVLYWFTLGGLDVVRPLNETVLLSEGWTSVWVRLLQMICIASVGISMVSSWWFFRPIWKSGHVLDAKDRWLQSYALWAFASLVAAAALSPIVLQGWQVVVALHAAAIPLVLWASRQWYRGSVRQHCIMGAYVLIQGLLVITLGYGHPIFRIPESLPQDFKKELNANLQNIIPVK